ncbi:MAG TPA: hypothetical protein PLE40_00140 [Candidatus Pacearchaeota archaeon]|nr:hypothetical protein [Candidatus Pacearchaeota archaeon]HOL90633.1 hypothetical protein [Candidatus Pacearchaeota archaeon]HPO68152.1 hypothetical protein [Candidatus Pacearchaeota archaeon]
MKYKVRFVYYYYTKTDTILANIYDVILREKNLLYALEIAEVVVKREVKKSFLPNTMCFVSITDEKEQIYVNNLAKEKNYITPLPLFPKNIEIVPLSDKNHNKLPTTFCDTKEKFFTITYNP